MKLLKQVVGIDIAMNELVCSFGVIDESLHVNLKSSAAFKNKEKGFVKFIKWVETLASKDVQLLFVMEATGIYHEKLANWLHERSKKLVIVLPNKISNYARTLDIKTVTDKTAAEAITRFGLERKLDTWQPPLPIFRKMRQLTREREQIVQERTVVKNQIHAEESEAFPNPNSLKRLKKRLKLLNEQEKEIKNEISSLVKENDTVRQDIQYITSIPGVGELTAAIILAETNGFELVRNKRQLTSFAGLDVKEKQSGISVKGKPKISKRGSKYLRKAVHLPALAAVKHCEMYKDNYARLVGRHGIKMKALVAIQRKLLELAFILYKTKKAFDPNYEEKRKTLPQAAEPLNLA
jgi:transposase